MIADWNLLLSAWTFRPIFLIVVTVLVWLYFRGLPHVDDPEVRRQPIKLLVSLTVLVLAIISPIHHLGAHFFFMRVLQHLLVISVFPSLFMSSDPLPAIFAGMPKRGQTVISEFGRRHQARIKEMTPKGVVWFFFISAVWIWYDPSLHALTLQFPFLRTIELLLMGTGALGHWWHVMAAHPRLHARLPAFAHMGYTIAGAGPLKIPGLFILFSAAVVYPYESGVFFGATIDPLLAQRMGGFVVWVFGGMVYTGTALGYFSGWLSEEEDKPPQPIDKLWDNYDKLRAPHLE